jgi:hypothetical protein
LRAVLVAWSAFDAVSISPLTRLPPTLPTRPGYWQAAAQEAPTGEHKRLAVQPQVTRGLP